MVFEQSLSGLIKALRASKASEEVVIKAALQDISAEVKSPEWDIKAGAVLKLTYLEMLGHPHLAQYSFPVIECMACPRLHIKQIGYLAASQSFAESTDTILLTNNLIKKDLSTGSASPAALLLTLSSLPPLLNSSQQLCDDLDMDMQRQLTHSRAQVRSSALLVLGSVWKRNYPLNPDSAEFIINKLADRLSDDDPSVICSAVNVMLEMARCCETDEQKAPFLRLAPECFELLTSSQNNWMLIKIIKLFAILTPVEPRLVRKLLPPLTHLISSTPAMSLLYECIHAVIVGNMLADNEALANVCVNKLASFLTDIDQNLRYIALLALTKLLPTHSHLLMPYSSIILKCVDDPDSSIRTRALELLEGMVDRSNLQAIVKKLLTHLQPPAPSAQDALTQLATGSASIATMANPEYKASLISRILRITTHASYAHISNFNWYVDLLVQLARLAISLPSTSTSTDTALEGQVSNVLIDVCARVRALRPYAISQCLTILLPERLLLVASAWIVGEYAVEGIDWKRASLVLREADCLYAAVKVLARWSANLDASEGYLEPEQLEEFRRSAEAIKEDPGIAAWPEVASLLEVVLANLAVTARPPPAPRFSSEDNPFASQDEQQDEPEGSTAPLGLKLLPAVIFPYELNPVNERAQSLVEVPEDLDLDTWLNPGSIPPLPAYEAAEGDVDEFGRPRGGFGMDSSVPVQVLVPKKSKKSKVEGQEDGKKKKKKKKRPEEQVDSEDIESIPIVKLDLNGLTPDKPKKAERPRTPTPPPVFVDIEGELPPARVSTPRRDKAPTPVPAEVSEKEEPAVANHPAAVQVVKKKKSKRPK